MPVVNAAATMTLYMAVNLADRSDSFYHLNELSEESLASRVDFAELGTASAFWPAQNQQGLPGR